MKKKEIDDNSGLPTFWSEALPGDVEMANAVWHSGRHAQCSTRWHTTISCPATHQLIPYNSLDLSQNAKKQWFHTIHRTPPFGFDEKKKVQIFPQEIGFIFFDCIPRKRIARCYYKKAYSLLIFWEPSPPLPTAVGQGSGFPSSVEGSLFPYLTTLVNSCLW